MIEVLVKADIAATPERLWSLVKDFGEVSWMNGVSRVGIDGEGVGMVRRIYVGDAPPVREVLESCDEEAKQIGYTITEGNPLPVKDYHATVTVVEAGPGTSQLEWRGRFNAKGVDDEQAEAALRGMYGVLISWLKAAAEKTG